MSQFKNNQELWNAVRSLVAKLREKNENETAERIKDTLSISQSVAEVMGECRMEVLRGIKAGIGSRTGLQAEMQAIADCLTETLKKFFSELKEPE